MPHHHPEKGKTIMVNKKINEKNIKKMKKKSDLNALMKNQFISRVIKPLKRLSCRNESVSVPL